MLLRKVLILLAFFTVVQVSGQKMLLLENSKTLKNFKFYEGDGLRYRLDGDKHWQTGSITSMNDSVVVFDNLDIVRKDKISTISMDRWFVHLLSRLAMTAGVFYFSIDTFNNLINSNYPTVDQQTAIISASLVAGGFLLQPLIYRKIYIKDNWKLKVLDLGNP